MERFQFLFDRLAKFWLPEGHESGDARRDARRAFGMQHRTSKGAQARIISGFAIVGPETTIAVFDANPERRLPNWLAHHRKAIKPRVLLRAVLGRPPASPSMLLEFGKAAFRATDIALSTGSVTVLCRPGASVRVDNRRVAAIRHLGKALKAKGCKQLRQLAIERDHSAEIRKIDQQLAELQKKAEFDDEQFFDLIDALKQGTVDEIDAAFASPPNPQEHLTDA